VQGYTNIPGITNDISHGDPDASIFSCSSCSPFKAEVRREMWSFGLEGEGVFLAEDFSGRTLIDVAMNQIHFLEV
jgi:hypothetical protein